MVARESEEEHELQKKWRQDYNVKEQKIRPKIHIHVNKSQICITKTCFSVKIWKLTLELMQEIEASAACQEHLDESCLATPEVEMDIMLHCQWNNQHYEKKCDYTQLQKWNLSRLPRGTEEILMIRSQTILKLWE